MSPAIFTATSMFQLSIGIGSSDASDTNVPGLKNVTKWRCMVIGLGPFLSLVAAMFYRPLNSAVKSIRDIPVVLHNRDDAFSMEVNQDGASNMLLDTFGDDPGARRRSASRALRPSSSFQSMTRRPTSSVASLSPT